MNKAKGILIMKKILRFKKQLSFLMLLILLCGLIAPVSEIKAEEKVYYIESRTDSAIIISDKQDSDMIAFGKKYGLMNYKGKVIVEPQYDYLENFSEGLAAVEKDGKWGFIDKKGREVIPLKFDSAGDFKNGVAGVYLKGLAGNVNKQGKVHYIKNSDKYDDVYETSYGLYLVERNEEYGLMNKKGKEVIPPIYYYLNNFSEGLFLVKKDRKYGIINKKGKVVVPIKYRYNSVGNFSEGLFVAEKDGKYGYIDKKCKEVIPFEYSKGEDFHDGLARVIKDYKYGYIDKKGRVVIPFNRYDNTTDFSEGLAAVVKDGKWGYIDKKGKEVIPLKYKFAGSFDKGLARVEHEDVYKGFSFTIVQMINKKGAILYYKPELHVGDSVGKTKHPHMLMLINKTGKRIFLPDYDYVMDFYEGLACVRKKDGKYGFIDENGKMVIELKDGYICRTAFYRGLALVEKDGKYGYIDRKGKVVVPVIYGCNY